MHSIKSLIAKRSLALLQIKLYNKLTTRKPILPPNAIINVQPISVSTILIYLCHMSFFMHVCRRIFRTDIFNERARYSLASERKRSEINRLSTLLKAVILTNSGYSVVLGIPCILNNCLQHLPDLEEFRINTDKCRYSHIEIVSSDR